MESEIKYIFNNKNVNINESKKMCAKKIKYIQQAFCVINNNKTDDNLNVLAIGLQCLGKTLEALKKPKEDCQYSLLNHVKEDTLREECVKLDLKDFVESSSTCTDAMVTIDHTQFSKYIKKVTLTEEMLSRERFFRAKSKNYLKHKYKCEDCIIGFYFKENLEDHVARKHSLKPGSVTCDICKQVIQTHMNYIYHRSIHFIRYQCNQCTKYFSECHTAMFHYKKKHSKENVVNKCRFCKFNCAQSIKFKLHMERKHNKFWCAGCNLVFITANGFQIHRMLKHSKKCTQCCKQFTTSRQFYNHMQLWHTSCAKCGIYFKTWFTCWKHMQVCNICCIKD